MTTDWVARGLGIAGAVSGFGALAWSVISWQHEGPVLKVDPVKVDIGTLGEVRILGRIANGGRLPTIVAGVALEWPVHGLTARARRKKDSWYLPKDAIYGGLEIGEPLLPEAGLNYIIYVYASTPDEPRPSGAIISGRLHSSIMRERAMRLVFGTATGRRVSARVRFEAPSPTAVV